MKIEFLQYLVTTAQCNSITDAANRLFLHQTTLSSAIKNIEETTNVNIFSRSKTGIALTEDGKKVVALAQKILDSWSEIMTISSDSVTASSSTLLVSSVIADQLSLLFLNTYRQNAPQGNLSISTVPQQHFVTMMLTGKYKMGVGLLNPDAVAHAKALFAENNFRVIPLRTHETYLYVNEHSHLASRDTVFFHELRNEYMALSEDGYLSYRTPKHAKILNKIMRLPNIHLVKQAVAQEDMIAFYVPLTSDKDDWFCRGTSIKKISLLEQPPDCTKQSFLVYKPDISQSKAEKALFACILNAFQLPHSNNFV